MDHRRYQFETETEYGPIGITLTSGTHAYLGTPAINEGKPMLNLKGQDVYAGLHIHLQDDGRWEIDQKIATFVRYDRGTLSIAGKECTDHQFKLLIGAITKAFTEWAAKNELAIMRADVAELEKRVERKRQEVREAEEKHRQLGEVLTALTEGLATKKRTLQLRTLPQQTPGN